MTSSPTSPADSSQVPSGGLDSLAISLALLLVRLTLGLTFIFHGSQKLFGAFGGPGMEQFSKFLGTMPTFLPPMAWAYMAALSEFVGGITVLLGLLARLGAVPIIITMLVAIGTVNGKNGFSLEHGGYEFCLNLIAMAAAILVAGPGKFSLDAVLFRSSVKLDN